MTEVTGATDPVQAALDDAAAAASTVEKPKKVRTKAEGAEKAQKAPKAPKLYPQWNEDGTPVLDEEGQQVMGEAKMKKPKAAKAAKAPAQRVSKKAPRLVFNGVERGIEEIQNEAIMEFDAIPAKEGSKRAERAKAFKNGSTVQDFRIAGGADRDLYRLVNSGVVVLVLNGVRGSIAGSGTSEASE